MWTQQEVGGAIHSDSVASEVIRNNRWHDLFESPKWILLNPAEEVVQFNLKYLESPPRQISRRIQLKGRRIHDLGCGGGRHILYFAELGYEMTGSDLSTNAIETCKKELVRRHMEARLVLCPMTELPFDDGEFDVTISRATLNHATLQDMKRSVFEVARTTRSGGLFFLTVSSERASDWRRGTEVVKDLTYIPPDGPEKGLIHTFFSATNAAALLEPFFRIEELYLSEHSSLITTAPGVTDPNQYFGSEYVIVGVRR